MLFKNNKVGKLGTNAAIIAGVGGGVLTIAIYAGVSMGGPLGLLAQIMGALGVISVALLVWSHVGK